MTRATQRLLAAMLATTPFVPGAWAASGGPDGFGYTWADSAEPAVTYAWEDISVLGTDVMVDGDDVNYGFQGLSFAFPYYGSVYSRVAICSNGWVSVVDDASTAYFNERLPDRDPPAGTIAVFWDDLDGTTGISRVLFADRGDRAVITWENVHDLGSQAAVNTFQVILHADGRIKAQYQSLTGERISCTAGIESPDDLHGLTAWFNDPAGIPASSYAIEYSPPVPVPSDLDCSAPRAIDCGTRTSGDTRTQGAALQDAYLCSSDDYAGREIVHELNFATPTNVRLVLESSTGGHVMLVLSGCDPNACLAPPGNLAYLVGVSGLVHVVVDSPVAGEGGYSLRVDCLPLSPDVDCAGATGIACDDVISADLSDGTARQDAYSCSIGDYSGREHVYRLDLRAPTNVEFRLDELGGDPDLIILSGCDPNSCTVIDSGSATLQDLVGSVYVVVDAAPGEEGPYELSVSCLSDNLAFCGSGLAEMDPWGDSTGVWLVNGWLYHPADTHDHALRVDGTTTYSTGDFFCDDFTSSSFGVRMPNGPAFTNWTAPEGLVHTELNQTTLGTCCGLMVAVTVTNTDTVPHYYEYRAYHDTAFGSGSGTGACFAGSTIDGGPIEVNGIRYEQEIDLLAAGGTSCAGQLQMFSADHPGELRASYQMLPPNLPTAMEYLDWDDGGNPCTAWQGLADGENLAGCSDNSVLFIWRFPAAGTLAPGESDTARYRIGLRCAWPCDVPCEDPAMGTMTAVDAGPCQGGIVVTWEPATFPGSGNGVYHVFRSTLSAADALTQPSLTPAGGISDTSFIDDTTVTGPTYHYAVVAESLDFPNCGTGQAVLGSTDSAATGPVTDDADVDPPATAVGNALRATGHTDSTVDFHWLGAPAPGPDEQYVILRADDDPQGPFLRIAETLARTWTDPDAPPRFNPVHVWFYDVRIADECGNMTSD